MGWDPLPLHGWDPLLLHGWAALLNALPNYTHNIVWKEASSFQSSEKRKIFRMIIKNDRNVGS